MKLIDNDLTNFRNLFGNSPRIKIMDFFLSNLYGKYNLKEIEKLGLVAYSSIKLEIPKLLEMGFLTKKEKHGKSQLYAINRGNDLVEALIKFEVALNKYVMKEILKEGK